MIYLTGVLMFNWKYVFKHKSISSSRLWLLCLLYFEMRNRDRVSYNKLCSIQIILTGWFLKSWLVFFERRCFFFVLCVVSLMFRLPLSRQSSKCAVWKIPTSSMTLNSQWKKRWTKICHSWMYWTPELTQESRRFKYSGSQPTYLILNYSR